MGFWCRLFLCKLLRKHNPTRSGFRYCVDCKLPLDKDNKPFRKSRKQMRFETLVHE